MDQVEDATCPTLFGQNSDEESNDDTSSYDEFNKSSLLLELEDVIDEPMSTLSAMLDVILPRIKPDPDIKRVSMEDQQSFASIIVGELANQFPVLHQEIDDPFLSEEGNQKLHQQMSIYVCQTIEELYNSYIYKGTTIQEGILSRDAHLSHLRAALAVEIHQRLNIPRMRAEILDNIRGPIVPGPVVERYCGLKRRPPVPKHAAVAKHGRPKKYQKNDGQDTEPERTQMDARAVITKDLTTIHLKTLKDSKDFSKMPIKKVRPIAEVKVQPEEEEKEEVFEDTSKKNFNQFTPVHRVSSLPNLWGDFILCDLNITNRDDRPTGLKEKEELMELRRPPSLQDVRLKDWDSVKKKILLGQHTREDLTDDLGNLMKLKADAKSDPIGQDEIYPLLQAQVLGLSKTRRARLQAYEEGLRKQEESRIKEDKVATTSVLMDSIESIPSVPTLEQLPYLNFEHVSGGAKSSNLSLHVKSGLPVAEPQESEVSSRAPSHRLADSFRSSKYTPSATMFNLVPSHSTLPPSQSERHSELSISFRRSSLGSREQAFMSPSLQTPRTPYSLSPTPGEQTMEEAYEEEKGEVKQSDYPSMATVGLSSGPFPSFPVSGQRSSSEVAKSRPVSTQGPKGQGREGLNRSEPVSSHYEPVPHDTVPEVSGPQLQPDVVTAEIPGQGPVRTAHVRVSNRVPLVELRLKPYGPIYNELEPKWDSTMTEDLDNTLYEGKEVAAVYKEIMNILPREHLQLDTEPTLEPSLNKAVNLSKILASNSLHHRKSRRVVNKDLHRDIPCPWTARDMSKNKWEGICDEKDENTNTSQVINTQDYLKVVSRGETDYLRLVYHLYDSQGSDSEDEEQERKKQEKLASLRAKLRAREERRAQRYKDKSHFRRGRWNVNTVTMGGLGGNISQSSDEEDEDSLRKLNEKAATMEMVQSNMKLIWNRLHMPELEQIDMAIKYSTNITTTKLNKVLNLWEQACNYIEKREEALLNLETFEKSASDPSRLLARGPRGSASLRLNEARQRDKLHSKLNRLDVKTSQIIKKLHNFYGDTVTYKGRVYAEKMRLDRTEMLYHLQQIRRQEILQPAIQSLALPPELQIPVHP